MPRGGPASLEGQQQGRTADSSKSGCKKGRPLTTWKLHRQAFHRNSVKCSGKTKRRSEEGSGSTRHPGDLACVQRPQGREGLNCSLSLTLLEHRRIGA